MPQVVTNPSKTCRKRLLVMTVIIENSATCCAKTNKFFFVCQSARGFGLNGADGGTIESGCESTYGYFLVDWTRADPIKPTPLKYHLNN